MEEPKKLEVKTSSSQRATSQHVESSVAKFMEVLYHTKESPCYHSFSDEMYETGLIFYAVEEYNGEFYIITIVINNISYYFYCILQAKNHGITSSVIQKTHRLGRPFHATCQDLI